MSRDLSIRRWATGALVVAFLAGGCGSGAVDGPGEDDDAASDQADDTGDGSGNDDSGDRRGGGSGNEGDGGSGGDTDRDRYSWNLPLGDLTPDDAVILYDSLKGGCEAGAAAAKDDRSSDGLSDQYRNLTEEQRKLYDAAIAVCRGDVELGRTLFAGAGYGGSRSMCFIYAGVVSVLEQRPPDTTGCPPNPGEGTTSTTESEESETSTEPTSTTEAEAEAETTTSTGEGETATTEATGVGGGGG